MSESVEWPKTEYTSCLVLIQHSDSVSQEYHYIGCDYTHPIISLSYFSLMQSTHVLPFLLSAPFLHFLQTIFWQLEHFAAVFLLQMVLRTSPQHVHFSYLSSEAAFCNS